MKIIRVVLSLALLLLTTMAARTTPEGPSKAQSPNKPEPPEEVVQKQIRAYNARNLESFLATYAPEAILLNLPDGSVRMQGIEAMRARYGRLFERAPELHAEIPQRIVLGNYVIYREQVHIRKGEPLLNVIAIYEVKGDLIHRVWFYLPDPDAPKEKPPVEVVQAQVAPYNARDLEAFAAIYSPEIEIFSLPDGKLLVRGEEEFRQRYTDRFQNSPDLHADILQRIALGNFVVDREQVIRRKGEPPVNAVAIYEVRDNLIQRVWFVVE